MIIFLCRWRMRTDLYLSLVVLLSSNVPSLEHEPPRQAQHEIPQSVMYLGGARPYESRRLLGEYVDSRGFCGAWWAPLCKLCHLLKGSCPL